jgi:hypothetical protein
VALTLTYGDSVRLPLALITVAGALGLVVTRLNFPTTRRSRNGRSVD